MSFEINNTNESKDLYLKPNLAKQIVKVDNNASVWDVYAKYDNGDNKLNENELNKLIKVIKEKKGDAIALSKKWGVSPEKAVEAIAIVNADSIATDVYKALNPGFLGKADKQKAKNLLLQVDKNNVNELFSYYQRISSDSSLVVDIENNFSPAEVMDVVETIAKALKESAKEQNVEIATLWEEYTNRSEGNISLTALAEIARRLELETRNDGYIEETYEKEIANAKNKAIESGLNFSPEAMLNTTVMQDASIKEKAKELKVSYSEVVQDGDGIIGNHSAKGVDVHSKLILNALNNLMKDPIVKEQIQAAYKKEGDIHSVILPGIGTHMTLSENQLAAEMRRGKQQGPLKEVNYGVIGDGDTNALVLTILKAMREKDIRLVGKTYKEQLANLENTLKDIFNPRTTE